MFPAGSRTECDVIRSPIESDRSPNDVGISVLTQAREELIERTVQSLVGAKQATVHMYNAAAPVFRRRPLCWAPPSNSPDGPRQHYRGWTIPPIVRSACLDAPEWDLDWGRSSIGVIRRRAMV